jgi:hypothetical protein
VESGGVPPVKKYRLLHSLTPPLNVKDFTTRTDGTVLATSR